MESGEDYFYKNYCRRCDKKGCSRGLEQMQTCISAEQLRLLHLILDSKIPGG